MVTFKMPKKMETRRLNNSDLKRLAQFLHGVPSSLYSRNETYCKTTKKQIKKLPRSVLQSVFSISSQKELCSVHKGLNHHLMNELWSWIRHELNSGVGKFLFPLIVSRALTADQEHKMRQLEPVLEMYRRDFKLELSAPPGREPINRGVKWAYEADQCPACILGRMGSDERVLYALVAGMIGRFPAGKIVHGKGRSAELTVGKLDNPKSKRLRFVRYWIKALTKDQTLLHEALELGIRLKKIHREWKDARRTERVSVYDGQYSLNGTPRHSHEASAGRNSVAQDPFRDPERPPTVVGWEFLQDSPHGSQVTEQPRTVGDASNQQHPALRPHPSVHRTSSSRSNHSSSRDRRPSSSQRHPTPREHIPSAFLAPPPVIDGLSTTSTLSPSDSISQVSSARVSLLRINKQLPNPHDPTIINYPPPPAPSTTSTIKSYDGGNVAGAYYNFDPSLTEEERLRRYKALLQGPNPFLDEERSVLGMPRPRTESIYGDYGAGGEEDPFGDVDVEGEEFVDGEVEGPEIITFWGGEAGRGSSRHDSAGQGSTGHSSTGRGSVERGSNTRGEVRHGSSAGQGSSRHDSATHRSAGHSTVVDSKGKGRQASKPSTKWGDTY
ncbi:hypothetical protein CC86DRAFT_203175 [Ophiobolus disseminans]|uniref:Uncharacterized protein n=1 Tax=Ophiobolus disseminans TaxID=1469910 RepID=A0A6A7A5A3_9PLEO|nr:hypothetical protein CC86DRAFT_203175 [Ophiobolus disseminans]